MIRQAEHLQIIVTMKHPRKGILCLLTLFQEYRL
jgi:hypothetical protein